MNGEEALQQWRDRAASASNSDLIDLYLAADQQETQSIVWEEFERRGIRPPIPRAMTMDLSQVNIKRLQVPFGDIFKFALKFAIAMIPVGIIIGICYSIIMLLFGLSFTRWP